MLKELEEKAPDEAKEAIQRAQENTLKRLKDDLSQMSQIDQERFKLYINKIQGDEEIKAEILENLRSELKENPGLREGLLETRNEILEKIETKDCPAIEKPDFNFCKDGRVVINKDARGCIANFQCLIPGEFNLPPLTDKQACITLWNPVCGENNRTYSNECFAGLAGIQIAYTGECGSNR